MDAAFLEPSETIVALSSGALPAGIAVVRLSGPAVRTALERIAGGAPEPRRASLRTLRGPDGEALDRGLVLFFPGPRSATGEDVVEFHLHGGRAVVAAVLAALSAHPGVRLAEAGEFTRRAFVNGRLDLTEAEGLADLLAAETDRQRRQALRQAEGGHRALYEAWSRRLLHARALIEASFDFSDEGDVADTVDAGVAAEIDALASEIKRHLGEGRRGEILREGFRVAIVGAPNAGKSSLLNALAAREAAIVSDRPGTTRDTVEAVLDIDGVPVRLIDTAGLRDTSDEVEGIGIARAIAAMEAADLVILLHSDDAPPPVTHVRQDGPRMISVRSKIDRYGGQGVSARTGAGLGELVRTISGAARGATASPEALVPTRARHRLHLTRALEIIREADPAALPPEILAENLRRAADALGALTGRTGVEDLLGVIFSEFCIGK